MIRSSVATSFAEQVTNGERVRCAVVLGPGGFGKSALAERLMTDLPTTAGSVVMVPGDLAAVADTSDASVVIVDGAERSPADFLDKLRAVALDPGSGRSVLVLSRSATASPALAELVALADRDGMVDSLHAVSIDDIAQRTPKNSMVDADLIAEITGSIPLHVDRLLGAWDTLGWPAEIDVGTWTDVPDAFVRHIGVQIAPLAEADREVLAERSFSQLQTGSPETQESIDRLIEAGLATSEAEVPRAVAVALRQVLTPTELEGAARRAGLELLQTNPVAAAPLLEQAGAPAAWSAAAWAAAGRFDKATKALDQAAGSAASDTHGAFNAAAAHIAGVEARWSDAARLSAEISDHPYWSDRATAAVTQLYAVLDGASANASEDVDHGFLGRAVAAAQAAFDASEADDVAAISEDLRSLVRQAPNQSPMLDVAVGPTELGALIALATGDHEVARSLVSSGPESSDRTPLNHALARWIEIRSGQMNSDDEHAEAGILSEGTGTPAAVAPATLDLAADVLESRRQSDAEAQAALREAIVELAAAMSVDLVTFDALCELHLGAQRLDARREARQISSGLSNFVARIDSPVLWAARLAWNQVEAAVVAGDTDAVARSANELMGLPGASEVAKPLVDAAQQWKAIFAGRVEASTIGPVLDELESHGYVWEAAALAGQAAIRATDGAAAKELLQRGREFRDAAPEAAVTSPAGLSEREIEIGRLVLAGHSYKEIGALCYISPKTVEHHISHIRQKLVVVGGSRAEFRIALEADIGA